MERAVVLGGFGGQGILFAGQVLAQAGLEEDRHVSWLPSYGPEMRGGTASCTVIVGDAQIGSPIVDIADVVIALNPPSLARFEALLAPGGLLVLNSSLIEADPTRSDIEVVRVGCSGAATDLGDERLVSVVALGAALARRSVVGPEALRAALLFLAGRGGHQAVERNVAALEWGMAAAAGAVPARARRRKEIASAG
jgi:2-oxoglutarate ferredoxin oxidoreductase subunit gamma